VPHGAAVRVHVERLDHAGGLIADVTPASADQLGLAAGSEVWASVKATEVTVYAAAATAAADRDALGFGHG
jgi:molybdopterin-binding protein